MTTIPAAWTGRQPSTKAVFYRTGGTVEWTWHKVLNRLGADAARTQAAEIERAGYKAVVVPWGTDLPTDYEGAAV